MSHTTTPHFCPPIKKGALKFEALLAARSGNVDKVKEFLADGGNVNGGDTNGMTLLIAASEMGRTEVLKVLLEQPDLHINIRHMGITALAVASINGHEGCVRAFLDSNLKCQLNLRIRCSFRNRKRPLTAICGAAMTKNWIVFNILVEHQEIILPEEASEIINCALDDDRWDIIETILKKDITFQGLLYLRLLQEALVRKLWGIIRLVFEKASHRNNIYVLHILLEIFLLKEWEKLEALLKTVDESVRIDNTAAEALYSHRYKELEKMLNENQIDAGVLSGILLLGSLIGCNDGVADILMSRMSDYTKETLRYALLIASMTNQLVTLPLLAKVEDFSYKTISLAHSTANFNNSEESLRLIKISLASKANKIFPNFSKCLKVMEVTEEDDDL